MEKISFDTKIISINNQRYQITVPKKLIDTQVLNPEEEYTVTFQEKSKQQI